MKTTIQQRFLMLMLSLAVVIGLGTIACEGPSGPEGEQGLDGPEGPVGPAGEDGSMMYSGEGEPEGSIGDPGDYYLNLDTGELYGPKNEIGWGTPISLQGPPGKDGENGQDGSQIYSGNGMPDASLGEEGDYYLNTSSYDFYGPKTENGWGVNPINLKGTANVIYSSWTTLDSAVRDSTIDGSSLKVGHIDAPQITQEVIDQGVVNVYMRFLDNNYPLPHISHAGGNPNVIDYLPRLNRLLITRFTMDNSASTGFNSSLEFRYVIIPGGVAAKSELSRNELEKMSYQEVMRHFIFYDKKYE